tara:strand:- start:109 stop:432 length:324 start_codon:yes stop_codon:yes gene_type:complete
MGYTAYSVKDKIITMTDGYILGAMKSINVGCVGLRNGNAYAEVQVVYMDKDMTKNNAVFYQEFGNNPLRICIGDDIEWGEDDNFKVLNDGKYNDDKTDIEDSSTEDD